MMDILIPFVAVSTAVVFGYMLGRWNGYKDGLPKRDKHGRFIKD